MQALPLFQHYLQLCEAHFEPDGIEVAKAFTEIAEAYSHVGRLGYIHSPNIMSYNNSITVYYNLYLIS